MRTGIRKALKITGWSFGSLLVLLAVFVSLLAFPGFMFAHQLEYRNFNVHSDQELGGELSPILARIDAQIAGSELNDPRLEHDIFLGHDNASFRAVQRARTALVEYSLGMKPAPNYNVSWPPHLSHVVILDVPDPVHDALLRPQWPGRFNMTHILTHEVAHSLVTQRLGIGGVMKLPMWKNEGYAEYVAAGEIRAAPGYSLRNSVARVLNSDLSQLRDADGNIGPLRYGCIGKSYLKDENGDFWHTCYYLSRVLVEYSLDVRKMDFAQLADPGVIDTEVMRELLADYQAGRL